MFRLYKVMTTKGEMSFIGKYRRDIENSNWYYYEKENGTLILFRKEHIVWVYGDCINNIIENKKGEK